jgi:prepilin-type N-terminal cleavage/methylation domain-containing protein
MVRERQKGFTTVELAIAMAVAGILAAIAIPNYHTWLSRSRVNGAALELLTDLQGARMRAVTERAWYVVTFNTDADSYSVYRDANNNEDWDPEELVKTVNIGERYKGIGFGYIEGNNPSGNPINSEVTFPGTPRRAKFRPSGLANGGSVYLIPMGDIPVNRKDRQRDVTVALTGRVRIYRHTQTGWE